MLTFKNAMELQSRVKCLIMYKKQVVIKGKKMPVANVPYKIDSKAKKS